MNTWRIGLAIVLMAAFLISSPARADEPVAKSVLLKRTDIEGLVQEMTSRGGRVAYVKIPVSDSDGVTVSQRRAEILKIAAPDRTENETRFLKMMTDESTSNYITDYREKQYDFTLPPRLSDPAILNATLQQFLALDPRYELKICGTLAVIVPRNDPVLNETGTLVLNNVPAAEGIDRLSKILAPFGIHHMELHMGPTPNDGKSWYGDTRLTLNLIDRPLIELCSRVAEGLGPEYTWSMLTIKGHGTNFGFSNGIR